MWRLVLLGAPGVGKGTQAELLTARLGTCQLSTGDVFRASKGLGDDERSPAMREAAGFMRLGQLVPDATVLDIVRERSACLTCRGGFLLDGFPRTVAQAQALERLLGDLDVALHAVISYELPIDRIVERLSGRRTCTECKAVFHVTANPPRTADTCDHCGASLIQREDDRPEAVTVRMAAYRASTAPLTDFYSARNLLCSVSADGTPEVVEKRTLEALGLPLAAPAV